MPGRLLPKYDPEHADYVGSPTTSRASSESTAASDNQAHGGVAHHAIRDATEGHGTIRTREWFIENGCTRRDLIQAIQLAAKWIVEQTPQTSEAMLQRRRIFGRIRNDIEDSPNPRDDSGPALGRSTLTFMELCNIVATRSIGLNDRGFSTLSQSELATACDWILRKVQAVLDED
ncbi:hypothetical protein LTR09_011750 [Extremus antarcticus]|uniref:Uncharacterized protein n=1 Tax=Extremus antarcticus TaxID=702011 RepID=A0AAJ0D666_9PEZI|nr:hypothetical protein LTR09_011750 [Extremus antarcticus]